MDKIYQAELRKIRDSNDKSLKWMENIQNTLGSADLVYFSGENQC